MRNILTDTCVVKIDRADAMAQNFDQASIVASQAREVAAEFLEPAVDLLLAMLDRND